MGNPQLWRYLKDQGALKSVKGGERNCQLKMLQELEDKLVAVDLSCWLMQASTNCELAKTFHSPASRSARVLFDRVRCCEHPCKIRYRIARSYWIWTHCTCVKISNPTTCILTNDIYQKQRLQNAHILLWRMYHLSVL